MDEKVKLAPDLLQMGEKRIERLRARHVAFDDLGRADLGGGLDLLRELGRRERAVRVVRLVLAVQREDNIGILSAQTLQLEQLAADGLRAMRLARSKAAEYGLDPTSGLFAARVPEGSVPSALFAANS